MFTQGFGEVVTDVLTVNPALQSIPSASSILDVSNFTFNAITLGKDAQGFKFHAHMVSGYETASGLIIGGPVTSTLGYNDGYVLAKRYNSISPSSYHASGTHQFFSTPTYNYKSVPNYPSIYDTRLERDSTKSFLTRVDIPPISYDTPDLGHYANPAIDSIFSSLWHVIGGYPPSGNTGKFMLQTSAGAFVCSGNLSGVLNTQGVVDKNGFIKINPIVNINNPSSGPVISTSGNLSANPSVYIQICLQMGDLASLALFGGINHIGVWCLDLKEMLASGLNPPYSWNNLNNTRKYKLVAKTTLWDDLLFHMDEPNPFINLSGLVLLSLGANYTGFSGPVFVLQFNFK